MLSPRAILVGACTLNEESPSGINVERALSLLWRRGPIVLACVLIAGGSAYFFARQQPKKYTATASVLFQEDTIGPVASGLGGSFTNPLNQGQQDTNVHLVGLGNTAQETAAQLGPRWSAAAVRAALSISANSDTAIVDVAATARSPYLAQKIANTYSTTYVDEQRQLTQSQLAAARALVNGQLDALRPAQRAGAEGLALADRAHQLALLAKLDSGGVSLAAPAMLPRSPSAPRVSRDIGLGALIALLIGLVLAFVIERLDPRVREPNELERIYGVPLLAAVPERREYSVLKSLNRSQQLRTSVYDEVFNLLRSYLRFYDQDHEVRKLMVISATPREGKTTLSYNLAKSAALHGRVLVIEADMRNRTIVQPLLDGAQAALPDVLSGDASIKDAIRPLIVGRKGGLDVLSSGTAPTANHGELIESEAMDVVLDWAAANYELVVIDTPPLTVVADAVSLLTKVDGVVVVGRMGLSRRDVAADLSDRLSSLPTPVLGVVANGVRPSQATGRRRRYGYGHHYGDRPEPPSMNGSASTNGAASATISAPEEFA
ncbi:MAG: AAA family ATPase [Actinobacteria bacterium]|nr:AAA family ATPase [Actinomycetota bacterium]